ncbi:MAG: YegP family protein [Pseudomonadota bacterium]|nr:YegP family protein [Pseudomonadota bacterium]
MAGKFEITKRKNGEFQFNLKAGNGQVILTSEGYQQMAGCANGIESVRKHAANDKFFERKTAKDGSPYFTLNASNGQVIGKSEMYKSKASCDNGIASVMNNAPAAKVVDKSAI